MSSGINTNPANLGEAAATYLTALSNAKREAVSQSVMNFVRWYGVSHKPDSLSPHRLAEYADGQPASPDGAERVKAVREFLNSISKAGIIDKGLSSHLKGKRVKSKTLAKATAKKQNQSTGLELTPEQKAQMEAELAVLKEKRVNILEEIKRAAADKDLKENAPYHAAREEKAKLDGKVSELEMLLKHAVVSVAGAHKKKSSKVELGRSVVVKNLSCGTVSTYKLVIPREVNVRKGCVSPVSPIGRAVMGCSVGDTVEVVAPACVIKYCIEAIE
jgi:transcription elongation factor GreA